MYNRWTAVAVTLCALGAPLSAVAQTEPPSIASGQLRQLMLQSPEMIRQRIRESGLTADDIRARLRAGGYPENLLDAYLDDAAPGAANAQPSAGTAAAIQALGFAPQSNEGLPLDTGVVRRPATTPSRVFGVDVFQRTSAPFLPLLAGPVPRDYLLGPGDQLVLILTGEVQKAHTLPVTREGFVLIPQVGQVYVANLTLAQLSDVLYDRLARVYSSIRRTPHATTQYALSVANVHANQIYVVGEVVQPGAYQISSLATVFSALYAAGGLTDRANLRRVEVQRLGKTVATLDVYDYLLRGDTRSDVRLETGDVVLVPLYSTRVQLGGAVARPAIYELKTDETLGDLIRIAGGFRHDAAQRRLTVHRVLPAEQRGSGPARAAIDVQLAPLPPLALIDGDSIVVDSVPPLNRSLYVSIDGMVNKPGRYPWRAGMTLRALVLLARGPAIGASLREAEIARLPADRSSGQLAVTLRVPLDSTYLYDRDSTGRYDGPPGMAFPGTGAADVVLQPFDNIIILKQPDFDFQRTIVLTGEVRYPGPYSLRTKNERIADVIERAGGLTTQAYAEGIRFVRPAREAGRINIDLPRALRDHDSRDNIILQPGDSIDIPEFQASVRVHGAVNSPGSVLWKEGASLAYYIDAAGGYAATADRGRTSVQFANGETRTKSSRPGPGSAVFVPEKVPGSRTDRVALITGLAQVVSSLVALAVVLSR